MTPSKQRPQTNTAAKQGRLQSRPAQPTGTAASGTQTLGLDATKDALLAVKAVMDTR